MALIALALWATLSTVQIVVSALGEAGGNDLYTYWYAGLHVRQGNDPYRSFLNGVDPDLPISFLDGEATAKTEIVKPDLQPAPGLTFPLILLLTPFAWFSFPTARIAWFILLMATNLLIPALLLRALDRDDQARRPFYLVLLAIFMGFSSTRYASISGQPSILVIALMLVTWIWSEDRPLLAGILLGIALSKYSLALGFWIYFTFIEWRPRLSISAAGVQIIGLFGLAWLGGNSLPEAVDGYIQLFLHHAPMEGIQLTSLLPGIDAYSPPLALALSASVSVPLIMVRLRLRKNPVPLKNRATLRAILLTLLTFWSLMVAYHRAYDLQGFIIALGSLLLLGREEFAGNARPGTTRLGLIYAALSIVILSLPAGGLLRTWLPATLGPIWIRLVLRASTWVILTGMALSILLLFQLTGPRKAPR